MCLEESVFLAWVQEAGRPGWSEERHPWVRLLATHIVCAHGRREGSAASPHWHVEAISRVGVLGSAATSTPWSRTPFRTVGSGCSCHPLLLSRALPYPEPESRGNETQALLPAVSEILWTQQSHCDARRTHSEENHLIGRTSPRPISKFPGDALARTPGHDALTHTCRAPTGTIPEPQLDQCSLRIRVNWETKC